MILAKYFVYKKRCENENAAPNVDAFVLYLKSYYNAMKFIAMKNSNKDRFAEDCSQWKNLLEV